MPQAVEISQSDIEYRYHYGWDDETGHQRTFGTETSGAKVPGRRVNYNNFPGIVDGNEVGYTIGVSETFAGVDPTNINFKFPLKSFQRGFFESNTTVSSAIKEDIKVLIMTSKGERMMEPDMGTNIPTLAGQVFENIDIEEMQMLIETEIREAIQRWMPFINVANIVVKDSEMDNSLKINQIRVSMRYTVSNTRSQDTIGFLISGQ